jgi:hypothetical protein
VLDKFGMQLLGANTADTVLSAAGANQRVVTVANALGDTRIEGLTVANGNTTVSFYGGGIYASDSDLNFLSCAATNNKAQHGSVQGAGYGGGLYAGYCTLLVSNCLFSGNTASGAGNGWGLGGGLYVGYSIGTVANSIILTNTAAGQGNNQLPYGGGLASESSSFRALNCLIAANRCTRNDDRGTVGRFGHGAYVNGGNASFENCSFVTNFGSPVGTTNYGEGIRVAAGTVGATNCIFWSHVDDLTGAVNLAFCDIKDGDSNGVNGCISSDPLFVNGGTDFMLSRASPCINAGINLPWMAGAVDLDGKPRIRSGLVDMGAFEREMPSTVFIIR